MSDIPSHGEATHRPSRLLSVLAAAFVLAVAQPAASNAPAGRVVDADSIRRLVVEEAMATSTVPPSLALAVAKVESNFRSNALSVAGARGVMQIMPATARGEFGVDPDELWDARLNVQLGIDFLGRLIERYKGRWDLALSHYNAGSVAGRAVEARPLAVALPYVEAVLSWEKRYRQDDEVIRVATAGSAQPPREVWEPANTRVAAAPQPTPAQPQPQPAAAVEAQPTPPAPTAPQAVPPPRVLASLPPPRRAGSGLDDFDDIDARRLEARQRLDDFAPHIRWTPG